jgi:hypothetical protein
MSFSSRDEVSTTTGISFGQTDVLRRGRKDG